MYQEITYPSSDKKTTIHAYIWRPRGQIRAAVQIIHGMAEYALRYAPCAEYLASHGFLVCAEDHLGHGKSALTPSELGYFDGGDGSACVLQDIRRLTLTVRKETGDLPFFVMGHSMGSFFCRSYIAAHGGEFAGAIIMGTGCQPAVATGFGKIVAAAIALFRGWKHRSRFIDRLAFGSYNSRCEGRTAYDWLSTDKGKVDSYIDDDLCGVTFTCGGFYTLFSIIGRACKNSTIKNTPKNLPVLLVAGSEDPVGAYSKGVEKLYNKLVGAGCSDVEMTLYTGARHEILNDACAPQVLTDLVMFMNSHLD